MESENASVDVQINEIEQLAAEAAQADYVPEPEALEGEHIAGAEPEIDTGELCTMLLTIGCSLVASRKGEHWNLTKPEAEQTGQAVGVVLDKYFPDLGKSGPEITAVLCLGTVFGPRLMQDKQIEVEAMQRAHHEAQQHAKSAEAQEVAVHGN